MWTPLERVRNRKGGSLRRECVSTFYPKLSLSDSLGCRPGKFKGRVSKRTRHYAIQSGDKLIYRGNIITAKGVHCNGSRVMLGTGKSVKITDIAIKKKNRRLANPFHPSVNAMDVVSLPDK